MPIYGFKVIYQERVYNCIAFMPEFEEINQADAWRKPKFLEVTIINEDGEIRMIHDKAWCFQFVPRVEGR
jgi:hypothetical protein